MLNYNYWDFKRH